MRGLPVALVVLIVGSAVVLRVGDRRMIPTRNCADGLASSAELRGYTVPPAASGPPPLRATRIDEPAAVSRGTRMFHGDAEHTHRSTARGPKHARAAWRTALGAGIAAQVVTSADESVLYAGTLGGDLVALDAAGGKEKWRVALAGDAALGAGDKSKAPRVYATPCVGDDGTIFVASDAKWAFAVSAAGKITAKYETGEEGDTAVSCGKYGVIVAAGRFVTTLSSRLDLLSRVKVDGKVYSAPIVAGDLIVFGSQSDRLYGARNGQIAWSADLGGDVDASPVAAADGSFWVGTDKGEVVHVSHDGHVVSRTDVGGFVRGSLTLAKNGDVLAGTYGPVPRVVRVKPDGTLSEALTLTGTGSKDFGVHGSPLEAADGVLYFGAQDDAAYGVGYDGELLFRYATKGDVDAPLTLLADGTLLVPSEDGTLSALRDP